MIFKNIEFEKESMGGYFIYSNKSDKSSEIYDLGEPLNFEAFTCSYRNTPFFMHSLTSKNIDEIPYETQYLMLKHTNGEYSVLVPLVDNNVRAALAGENGHIKITVETGDKNVGITNSRILYITTGKDIYEEIKRTSEVISKRFGLTLRKDKKIPAIHNKFGWCTWNAFDINVSEEKVIEGLDSFKQVGVEPRFLILDDGWQVVNDNYEDRGDHKLSGFSANEKFHNDLSNVINRSKKDYKIDKFYVWHAVMGYWGGIDTTSPNMAKYNPFLKSGDFSEYLRKVSQYKCGEYGMASKDKVYDFYNDYHTALKNQGVDGVKIDTQFLIEAHADGLGGRVEMYKTVHDAMEKSVENNFDNELINCMSCANDILFALNKSNMIRTSDDFIPEDDKSHGKHIYNNAINSILYKDFTYCDWDMFQTGHKFGAYHGASRAVSGSPVYVTDEPNGHDINVLKSLVMSDGTVPMAIDMAMPTVDSLFKDPFKDDVLFKMFNKNRDTDVVGIFNMKEGSVITDYVKASEINGANGQYAVYSYKTGKCYTVGIDDKIEVTLNFGEFDILTYSKIENDEAVIGLTEFYNSGATFEKNDCITVKNSGTLLVYRKKQPKKVFLNNKECEFTYENGFLKVALEDKGKVKIED